jgi:hypothetical protein
MHVFLMLHGLDQLEMRFWIAHILNIVVLAFMIRSRSFPRLRTKSLFAGLLNSSLRTVSDDHVLLAIMDFPSYRIVV